MVANCPEMGRIQSQPPDMVIPSVPHALGEAAGGRVFLRGSPQFLDVGAVGSLSQGVRGSNPRSSTEVAGHRPCLGSHRGAKTWLVGIYWALWRRQSTSRSRVSRFFDALWRRPHTLASWTRRTLLRALLRCCRCPSSPRDMPSRRPGGDRAVSTSRTSRSCASPPHCGPLWGRPD